MCLWLGGCAGTAPALKVSAPPSDATPSSPETETVSGKLPAPTLPRVLLRLPETIAEPAILAVSRDGDVLAFGTGDPPDQTLYVASPAVGTLREVTRGRLIGIEPAPRESRFAVTVGVEVGSAWTSDLRLVDGSGGVHWSVRHPDAEGYFAPSWLPDGTALVFPREAPGLTPESSDFDPLGFSAVGVVGAATGQVSWFPVKTPAHYLAVDPQDARLYVSNLPNENEGDLAVTVYSPEGRELGEASGFHGTLLSARGRYYVPQLHEGGLPFEIYDRPTNSVLWSFAGAGKESNDHVVYGAWNPWDDDLLFLTYVRAVEEDAELTTTVVFSVSEGKAVQQVPGNLFAWGARDRMVAYEDRAFVEFPARAQP